MTEINPGVDCRRRLRKPRNRLRLERRHIYAQPEELIRLQLLEVPTQCDASCYNWVHARGGGTLDEEVGTAVWFRAPMDFDDCKDAVVINVSCQEHFLDTAYISSVVQPTPRVVLKWFEENRTWPSPPAEYLKYRATVIKTYGLHEVIKVYLTAQEQREFEEIPFAPLFVGEAYKLKYIVAGPITFPTTKILFRVTHSYDCNGIYLQTQAYARYGEGMEKWFYDRYVVVDDPTPLVVDARSPFLKGEPVTLDEGAIIPFGWKPNTRRLPGLNVPAGTIWPADWKKGDPLPHWECCPFRLLEAGLL